MSTMRVAVVGEVKGELDKMYARIAEEESALGIKISLILTCGAFQGVRNETDLRCLVQPEKFGHNMGDFHK